MVRKHQFVTYIAGTSTISAQVRRVHRDGTVSIEARHELDERGEIKGAYLGYRFRMAANQVSGAAA